MWRTAAASRWEISVLIRAEGDAGGGTPAIGPSAERRKRRERSRGSGDKESAQ